MSAAYDLTDMAYYEPPERTEPLTARVPASLKATLNAIVALWRLRAIADGMAPDKAKKGIDLTYVVVRLLTVGADNVWSEVLEPAGLSKVPDPNDAAAWSKIEKVIRKMAAETKSK